MITTYDHINEEKRMEDFNDEVKQEYEALMVEEKQLKTQLANISKRIKPLRLYLTEVGMIEKKVGKRPSK